MIIPPRNGHGNGVAQARPISALSPSDYRALLTCVALVESRDPDELEELVEHELRRPVGLRDVA
jgi:hypothetical protein